MNVVFRIATALILLTVLALPAQAQVDAESLFREGNTLFRSGIYSTALARYREAAARGLDTAILHYNTGVAAFKLGDYESAEIEFRRAQDDPALGAVALYNLGLTYRRVGRALEAERSFREAAGRSSNSDLTRLAQRAADAVARPAERVTRAQRPNSFRDPASRPQIDSTGKLRVLISARLGQDDNVYRAPSRPYVDLAAPGQPLVTPIVQSASFMPVDVFAEYTMRNEPRDTLFRFAYRLDGDFYESEYSNANRVSQLLQIGADVEDLATDGRRRKLLQSSFYLIEQDETNFDPDSGIDRDFNGIDISDRFRYSGAGVRVDFEHALRGWTYGINVRFEGRQYDDVPLLPSYDHDLAYLRLEAAFPLSAKARLETAVLTFQRVYDNRLARDLNGNLLTTNETLEYDYTGLELGVTYRVVRALELSASFLQLDRADKFLGYFDSTQNQLRFRATYQPTSRIQISASARVRAFDYPNAFAFDDPVAGSRDLDDVGVDLRGEFRFTPKISLWAEVLTDEMASSDPRLEYSRTRSMLGLLWRY